MKNNIGLKKIKNTANEASLKVKSDISEKTISKKL
jgi:hypothetical protein